MNMNGMLGRAGWGVMTVALSISLAHASAEAPGGALTSDDVAASHAEPCTPQKEPRLARLLREASFSPGVSDVIRMTKSGTDTPILIAHVQASDHAYKLRPEDIFHLNNNEVPDSVIASMIVRGAELRAKEPPVPPSAPLAPAQQPCVSAKVSLVSSGNRTVPRPASTVTVIGRSDLRRRLSNRNHSYSSRNFYNGIYGRGYPAYDRCFVYGSSQRRSFGRW